VASVILVATIGLLAIYVNNMFVIAAPLALIPAALPFAGSHKIGEE
jgi:hypothetical protein